MLAEAAIVAESSDFPHHTSTRYREMAVKATSEAQAATWFVPRWSYKREAQRWENLATEASKELRMEIARANRAMEGC